MTNALKILEYAIELVRGAERVGLELRIAGSVAVCFYVKSDQHQRPTSVKDIDLVTRRENRRTAQHYMSVHGWTLATQLLMLSELRETYTATERQFTVDLYYDQIDGNHPTVLRDRLGLSFPAISCTDLLLSKLQRLSLRESDVWDTCELLRVKSHEIDERYFEGVVRNDWGLYISVTDNLSRLVARCSGAHSSVEHLLLVATRSRKTLRWRLRSAVGRRVKWWREVYGVSLHHNRG